MVGNQSVPSCARIPAGCALPLHSAARIPSAAPNDSDVIGGRPPLGEIDQHLLADPEDAAVARHPQAALLVVDDLKHDVVEQAVGRASSA